MTLVALDLGGTKLAAAAFTEQGEIVERESLRVSGSGGSEVGQLVIETAQRLVTRHGASAVGVCVPGLYRAASGTVWAPNIPDWEDYPLRAELQGAVGGAHVVIDSDRAAYILGETWAGAARGATDAVFLAVGTGIGAGVLSGGRIVRGAHDIAGAVGWLALDRPFRERFATHGAFEDQASGAGLARVAKDLVAHGSGYRGTLDGGDVDAATVFRAAENGDEVAKAVIDNAVELWGMAAANLVSLLNPQIMVFGGGVFGPATKLLDRIHAEAARWAQPLAMREVRFVASALEGDAGLYGAARLAMLGQV